ncbi:acyl-CoA thioesterase II [Marihabitans asiaticum]|uniref:Acyl-CoA thioesterase 2 n=1 Tax=Marihabitans asiaticum TaxID=415218 RepID=A0A560W7Y5_9MICO|nr:acyl-CoA thioesterase II [Marihabitans asiaticum]TWD13747.1 acyl-CoA thioesterase-2 [Marihabitans asiaticum]
MDDGTQQVRSEAMADLLDTLDLTSEGSARITVESSTDEPVEVGTSSADVFVGRSQPMPYGRAFGGQVLAQALIAGSLTLREEHPERHPHSLHAYFMRPGDASQPIRFAVERMRDGRSFSTRRVHAIQRGAPILSMTASFQDDAGGIDHQDEAPEVPGPDELPSLADQFSGIDDPKARHIVSRPIEHRHVQGSVSLHPAADASPDQDVWFRAVGPVADDPFLRAAVLAYASDYTVLEPALRRHGLSWADHRLRPASLDHAMWFHRPVDPAQWLLYSQHSPSAQGGRGLSFGRIFDHDGRLVASVAQEGMLRVKDETKG